ncbi:MAG TPA: hypothetical protein PKL77_00375 [Candidatus Omnitrophota bacterium]|nr:hypothetical protein [Candidatus Omnitrophota bacterium]HPT06623.1 hypothetical protein [Candidatus Omnitrophota bacterium]
MFLLRLVFLGFCIAVLSACHVQAEDLSSGNDSAAAGANSTNDSAGQSLSSTQTSGNSTDTTENTTSSKIRVKHMSGFSSDMSLDTKTGTASNTSNTSVSSKSLTPEEMDKEFKEKYKVLRSQ